MAKKAIRSVILYYINKSITQQRAHPYTGPVLTQWLAFTPIEIHQKSCVDFVRGGCNCVMYKMLESAAATVSQEAKSCWHNGTRLRQSLGL